MIAFEFQHKQHTAKHNLIMSMLSLFVIKCSVEFNWFHKEGSLISLIWISEKTVERNYRPPAAAAKVYGVRNGYTKRYTTWQH